MHLGKQIYPNNSKFIQEAYKDATSRPHGYLMFDLKQDTPETYRYRSYIFGKRSPGFPIIYTPKEKTV